MELKWNYGQGVLVLPASALSADATPQQLTVLLWLASDASLTEKPLQLARLAGVTAKELDGILSFWKSCGVLSEGEETAVPAAAAAKQAPSPADRKEKPLQRADELPTYTQDELSDMMEARQSLRVLADESQRILGKMFNPMELNVLFGMVDYLNLDEEYILLLLAHCKRMGKTGMRPIERYAVSLVDQGITDSAMLVEKLQTVEAARTLEGRVRSLFGMSARAFTQKERKFLEAWVSYGYDESVIELAYEITANTTGKASLPYAHSILERWHTEGLNTKDAIEKRLAEEKAERQGVAAFGNSFETDDFFQAALDRSFRRQDED